MLRIGIDIDNVIVNTTSAVLEYLNERFPIKLELKDITHYYIEDFIPEPFKWAVPHAFKDKEMWKKVRLIPRAKECIEKLYLDGHEIYFVTSSLPENLRKKIKHLERNLDFLPKGFVQKRVININNKQLLDLDILIDDYLGNLTGKRRYYSICLGYPWNVKPVEEYNLDCLHCFFRCYDWDEIYKLIGCIKFEQQYEELGINDVLLT